MILSRLQIAAVVTGRLRVLKDFAVWFCALVGLLFLLVTFTPFVSWYAGLLAGDWTAPKGDTLIVLAGADLDGIPDTNSLLRCIYGLRAYQAGEFRKVAVSGRGTSHHMRSLLIAEGVPAEAVIVEDEARSTRENALHIRRLLAADVGSKVLLTSDYHAFRAKRSFQKAGVDITARPIPDAMKRAINPLRRWPAFLDEVAETGKIAYYFLRGWI